MNSNFIKSSLLKYVFFPEFDADTEVLNLFSSLFAKMNLANKTVEDIIEHFRIFFEDSLTSIYDNIKEGDDKESVLEKFKKSSFEVTNAMQNLNSKQKIVSALKKRFIYMEPSQFVINEHTIEKLGEFESENSHGVIMPIEHTIKCFLELPNVFESIVNNQSRVYRTPILKNIIQGKLWSEVKKRYEGKYVIPIYLYNDDFHPDNSTSPHAATGKLGAYYYSFPTLPDYLATNLNTIFLAALVKVSDIDQTTVEEQQFDPALFAIFEMISVFETDGIRVNINGNLETVYIVLPQLLGDNLALNQSLGFIRGFTGMLKKSIHF